MTAEIPKRKVDPVESREAIEVTKSEVGEQVIETRDRVTQIRTGSCIIEIGALPSGTTVWM